MNVTTRAVLIALNAMLATFPAKAQTVQQRLAIPGFYPVEQKHNGVDYDWVRIQRAGSAVKFVVAGGDLASGAGGTGPGTGCTSSPKDMFDCLHRSGQLVLGYVATGAAQRDLLPGTCACPRADQRCSLHGGDVAGVDAQGNACKYPGASFVDQWYQTYCPSAADCHIDGIFFDTGPDLGSPISEANQESYYQSLYQAVIARGASGSCGAPPGHPCVMVNAAQFPHDWVLTGNIADFAVVWERSLHGSDMVGPGRCEPNSTSDAQDYLTLFCPWHGPEINPSCSAVQSPASWMFAAANTPRIAHVIFGGGAGAVNNIVQQSRSAYGTPGLIYVHDEFCDTKHGAVYSHLPDYFEQLVSILNPSLDVVLPVRNASTGATVWVPLSF